MNHKQILKKIPSSTLVEAIEEDVAIFDINNSEEDIKLLLNRWNCVLLEKSNVSENYKQQVYLIIATLLHKHGIKNKNITQKALLAIDKLNEEGVLSDAFERQSPEIKTFLQTEPKKPTRRPAFPKKVTFFRAKDVVAIQLHKKYVCAYIHEISGCNEYPIIEFYGAIFDKLPSINQLNNIKAIGLGENDKSISKFNVYGMKFQPDLANQIHLIDVNNTSHIPCNKHLNKQIGLYTLSDIFDIQRYINSMFFGLYGVL